MKFTPKKETKKVGKKLSTLGSGDIFVKDYHDVDAIFDGTYSGNWSCYMVLPSNSKYLANRISYGHVFVMNLKKQTIHCISGDSPVHPMNAELQFSRKAA